MKRIQVTSLIMVLSLTIGVFSGCSGTMESAPSFVDVDELNNSLQPKIEPIYFEENSGSSNLETNSSVASAPQGGDKSSKIIIPTSTEYNVCSAEYFLFNPEKFKTTLLGNVNIAPEIRDFSKDDPYYKYPTYTWNVGNTSLNVDNNSQVVSLSGDLSALLRTLFFLPTHNSDGNIEKFEHRNDDLDFCTSEQAVKNVKETLSKMDITVSENASVYAIHQSDLQEVINGKIKTGKFYDPHTSKKDPNAKPLTSYTVEKSQECYYIAFREEFDGVPIYNQNFGYRSIKDLTMFHPRIIAIYSSSGLVGLQVSDYRGNISITEKITQVVSAESAAQVVAAKYTDVAGIKQVDFNKVELMYVITPNYIDGKVNIFKARMVPAWICTISYTQWAMDKMSGKYADISYKETVLIDAQTGAEII